MKSKIKIRYRKKDGDEQSHLGRSNTIQLAHASQKLRVLQISIGIIYLWFGILKFFNGLSPAESLAVDTIQFLTAGI